MAIYHCTTKPISRSKGRSAVAAAAYRAGQRIEDQHTGITHNYTQHQRVGMTITFLPDGEVCDRSQLWNAAELAEKRKDARTAREWVIALPAELNADQRAMLARFLSDSSSVALSPSTSSPSRRVTLRVVVRIWAWWLR